MQRRSIRRSLVLKTSQLALVFALTFLGLQVNVNRTGIASGYVDPVGKIAAQDEAVYTHTTIHMATQGEWLTPYFLDRLALYKPPMLYWFSAFSAKLFGICTLALRLPSLLAAAGIATVVFWWTRSLNGVWSALASCVLLVSDPLFFTLARLNLTDMLLAFWIAASAALLCRDPLLVRRRTVLLLSLCSGLALMTKGIAGAIPLILTGAVLAVQALRRKPFPWVRFSLIIVVTALIAGPWHLYQLLTHGRWFWTEYILTEHLSWGLAAPQQTSNESQAGFYIRRILLMDPILVALAFFGLWRGYRQRGAAPTLVLLWILTILSCALLFHYRNIAYLLPVIPALCLAAAPALQKPWFLFLLLGVLALRIVAIGQVWSLPVRGGSTIPSASSLHDYCKDRHGRELIIVSPDDEFLSAVLPLEHVRYAYIVPSPAPYKLPLDFEYLGVTVAAREFNTQFANWAPKYSTRLRDWGVQGRLPIATVVLARNTEEVWQMIESHPAADFSVPRELLGDRSFSGHSRGAESGQRVYLLSERQVPDEPPQWSCGL